jgi:glycosyltransferase involved in cell wall biosynthesis
MRILHIQKVKGAGGSERHLLSLLPALAERGVEIRMCVLGTEEYGRFTDPLRAAGVETTVIPAGFDLSPGLVRSLHREIRAFGPDLVHTHLVHGDVYGQVAARAAAIPAVSTVHSTHAFYRREPVRSAGRLVGRLARRTIAISNHVRRFVLELGLARAERLAVVPYGIDPEGWMLPERERASTRAALGIGEHEVVAGMAARLVPGKGHRLALEALDLAIRQVEGLSLLVAGDGPLRDELEGRARRLPPGTVRFLGYVGDVRSFMNASDVLLFPTSLELGEGFGLAALEAMAAARPVVATRVASLPEVVSAEETGLLVEPDSARGLADALVRLGSDRALRRKMGDRGRQRATAEFSLDRMVDRTVGVYREALASGARR